MEVLTAVALTRRGRRRLGDVVTRHEDVDWSRRGERTARGKIRSRSGVNPNTFYNRSLPSRPTHERIDRYAIVMPFGCICDCDSN